MDLAIKIALLIVFFGVMIGIGLYCRRHATDVNGFVLGGRSVGPWLTAFAYGTSYFSAVVFPGALVPGQLPAELVDLRLGAGYALLDLDDGRRDLSQAGLRQGPSRAPA